MESHKLSLKPQKLLSLKHFIRGEKSIPRERESYFQGKIVPQRENLPSDAKFAHFSLGGTILPQKMSRVMVGPAFGATEKFLPQIPLKPLRERVFWDLCAENIREPQKTTSNHEGSNPPIFRRLFVTCDVFARYISVAFSWPSSTWEKSVWAFSWLFRGPHFGQILRVLALEKSSEISALREVLIDSRLGLDIGGFKTYGRAELKVTHLR